MRQRHLRPILRMLPALLLATGACGDDATAPTTREFRAQLAGISERPRVVQSAGTGTAVFTETDGRLTYTLDVSNLTGVVAAHVHLGGTAVAGPVLVTLYGNTGGSTAPGRLAAGEITASAIGQGVTVDSLLALFAVGHAYVNVHTTAFGGGEVRGQIVPPGTPVPPERFSAVLNGANERPNPVTTAATGTATLEVSGTGMRYAITAAQLSGVTAAHIHTGDANSSGGVLVTLFGASPATGTINGTLVSGTFAPPAIGLDSLLVLLRTGNAYFNVHTQTNTGGEIRGQAAAATVIGAFPASTSSGSGPGYVSHGAH